MTNLSDAEIIKALTICANQGACKDCPLDDLGGVERCMHTLLLNALDLINRLKAEITRLNGCVKTEEEVRIIAKSVIDSNIALIKSEARKEFAEAYKDQIKNYTGMFTDEGFYVSLDAILNAVDFVFEKLQKETGCNNA